MKILIVGAGIAGLAAARALQLRGYRPEIVERHAEPPTAGQSIFLLGNAMRALGDLGLKEQIQELSFPVASQTILSSRGALLNHVVTDRVWGSCGPCVALLRKPLVDALRNSLVQTQIEFGTTVLHTIHRGDRRDVYFSDGRVAEYDLIIGADGIRSSMRAANFSATAPRSLGLSAWRLLTDNRYAIESWTAMLGSGRTLLAIPLSKSELYLYADCATKDFGNGSIPTLKMLFRDFAAPLGAVVADLDDEVQAHRSDIEEVASREYLANRLVLIGDAAHAASPSMAQGAGMAIEDAVVLAECISRAQPMHRALSEFRELRKHRVEWVQKQSRARDKLRTAPDIVRNTILRTIGSKLYRRSYGSLLEPLWR